jgi:hypothetical protein
VLCAVALAVLVLANWLRWLLRDQAPAGAMSWLEGTITALGFAGIPVVGAVIATRLPANPIGWLWCALGLAYAVGDFARPLQEYVGWPEWAAWLLGIWSFVAFLGLLVFVFLLFPTGRLPTYRWRWFARAAVAASLLLALAVPFIHAPSGASGAGPWVQQGVTGRNVQRASEVLLYAMFGFVLAAMSSLALRFRRAGPVERRQLTWFLYATAVNGALILLDSTLGVLPQNLIVVTVSAASFALLPVAVGVAVLRYRLFEIDRIVSRTVSYGLLTAGLVGLYLLVVALLRPLLEPLTGSSSLAVAASTLAVAAVFNPARRRLQAAVDQRFDRARYDAAQAVDTFAARLRTQVDLDQITDSLCETVTATVAPGRVAVWLRAPTRIGGPQP